jgi:cytochrome b involved in lipid metabolism
MVNALVSPFVFYAILAITVYSFVINYLFGHQTFWKAFPSYLISTLRILNRVVTRTKVKSLSYQEEKAVSLNTIDDDLLLIILNYLKPYEITAITSTSKSISQLCNHHYLWRCINERMLVEAKGVINEQSLHQLRNKKSADISPKILFFQNFRLISSYILSFGIRTDHELVEDVEQFKCRLMVSGEIYDLTHFKMQHPGGIDVLLEWNGTDVTKQFRLAHHSDFAKGLAKNYLIWSTRKLLGRRGTLAKSLSQSLNCN